MRFRLANLWHPLATLVRAPLHLYRGAVLDETLAALGEMAARGDGLAAAAGLPPTVRVADEAARVALVAAIVNLQQDAERYDGWLIYNEGERSWHRYVYQDGQAVAVGPPARLLLAGGDDGEVEAGTLHRLLAPGDGQLSRWSLLVDAPVATDLVLTLDVGGNVAATAALPAGQTVTAGHHAPLQIPAGAVVRIILSGGEGATGLAWCWA